MSISVLPDNCLMCIFGHLNHMNDLETMRSVCVRWKALVEIKLKRIKNAICYEDDNEARYFPHLPYEIARQTVYIRIEYEEKRHRKKYRRIPSHLLPNLEIIDTSYVTVTDFSFKNTKRQIGRFLEPIIRNPEKITALSLPRGAEKLANHFKNLSIYSSFDLGRNASKFTGGSKLKQLYLASSSGEGPFSAEYQNLELLKTSIIIDTNYRLQMDNHGTRFPKLETLIMHLIDFDVLTCTFDLVKDFPVLRSFCLKVEADLFQRITFSGRHISLKTLVLNFRIDYTGPDARLFDKLWSNLLSMLQLYPSIKHLAIVSECDLQIYDSKLLQLLERLPGLVLLKLEDKGPTSLIRVIEEFNSQSGRSIRFTRYEQMDPSFMELTTKKNNDFMRKYFFVPSCTPRDEVAPVIA